MLLYLIAFFIALLGQTYFVKMRDWTFSPYHSIFLASCILLFLKKFQNERKVLTRENIVEKVWGYDYFGETRIIDTHIKNLRKKLAIPYIKTIKGIGYKIDE